MYNECDYLTPRHKITIDRLTMPLKSIDHLFVSDIF